MKGLVIDEPWIGMILRGEKTWEMRKGVCNLRGPIGLIRKCSGLVVGTARLVDSRPALTTPEAYAAAERFHGIPPARQARALADGWATPWVLADARPLAKPVPYQHPYGAVIWVNLPAETDAAIAAQAGAAATSPPPATFAPDVPPRSTPPRVRQPPPETPQLQPRPAPVGDTRRVVVTGGNLRNNHIYLPLDFFPDDAIGGRNKDIAATRKITVVFDPGATVETDIDGTKRILRARGPVGDFLARAGVEDGNAVLITRTAPYSYTIRKAADV